MTLKEITSEPLSKERMLECFFNRPEIKEKTLPSYKSYAEFFFSESKRIIHMFGQSAGFNNGLTTNFIELEEGSEGVKSMRVCSDKDMSHIVLLLNLESSVLFGGDSKSVYRIVDGEGEKLSYEEKALPALKTLAYIEEKLGEKRAARIMQG